MLPQKIAIVGCGNIGSGWAAYFLSRGLHVSCCDPAPHAESRLHAAIREDFDTLALDRAEIADSLERLSFSAQLESVVEGCDWVQENAPEDRDLKLKVIRAIDAIVPSPVVIASSTSGIEPSALQIDLKHPERVIAGHPFLPVSSIPLVEVAGGKFTSEAAMVAAMEFYSAVGKVPIRLHREMIGHIANRLQAALMREAFYLLEQGAASAADIDRALTEGLARRWAATGPFVTYQLAGGPGGAAATFANLGGALKAMWADLGTPAIDANLQAKIEAGIKEILSEVPEPVWRARRISVLRTLARSTSTPS